MTALPRLTPERAGDLFEVVFAFLFLPLLVATLDPTPFRIGGHLLLWFSLFFLERRLDDSARSRLRSRLRVLRGGAGGWFLAVCALVAFGLGGALLLDSLGLWAPPGRLAGLGWSGSLGWLLAWTLFSVLPTEFLFRVYLPSRFPRAGLGWGAGFLFAWFYLPTLEPRLVAFALAGGLALLALARLGTSFRLLVPLHALGGWFFLFAGGF